MFRRLVTAAPLGGQLVAAVAALLIVATPALAYDHTVVQTRDFHDHDHDHHDHGHGRGGFGIFLGSPAYVAPPPVYYAPAYPAPYGAYPYAPVPVTGVYATPRGYCQNYRTAAGIETACQGADGVWRFIN